MARQETARVIGVKINDSTIFVPETHFSVGTILTFYAPRLHYMSSDALLNLLDQTADTCIELGACVKQAATAKELAKDLRMRNDQVLQRRAWLHETEGFRELVLGIVCEYILRCDDLGRLHGFTVVRCHAEEGTNVGDGASLANPEMKTIRSIENV